MHKLKTEIAKKKRTVLSTRSRPATDRTQRTNTHVSVQKSKPKWTRNGCRKQGLGMSKTRQPLIT